MIGRATLQLICLVAFGVGAGLAIGETGLRLLGFRFETFPAVQFGWPEPATIVEQYRPDRELFWVPRDYSRVLAEAAAAHPAIAFMGDSCTEFGSYPARTLERLAADRASIATGLKVGVGGWSTEQGLAQLRRDVLPLRPRVITVYFGWNDHWVALGPTDRQARPSRLYFWLSEQSRLVQLLTKSRLGIAARTADRLNRVALADYRENLETMAALAKGAGIRMIFVTAPAAHVSGQEPAYLAKRHLRRLEELIPLHQAYVEATREAARASGVEVCDAALAFSALAPPAARYFISDGIHLTDAGDQAMADLLARCIEVQVTGHQASRVSGALRE
jgi:lysophospholipase L1-like esterase